MIAFLAANSRVLVILAKNRKLEHWAEFFVAPAARIKGLQTTELNSSIFNLFLHRGCSKFYTHLFRHFSKKNEKLSEASRWLNAII